VARMIKKHREGILNAIVLRVTNAKAEATNSQIQKIKRRACGFRSRSRFRTAILFHLGGLDLYPKSA
jgi:transposase